MSSSSMSVRSREMLMGSSQSSDGVSSSVLNASVSAVDVLLFHEALDHVFSLDKLVHEISTRNFTVTYLRGDISSSCDTLDAILHGSERVARNWMASRVWLVYDFVRTHHDLFDESMNALINWSDVFRMGLCCNEGSTLALRKFLVAETYKYLRERKPRISAPAVKKLTKKTLYSVLWKRHNTRYGFESVIRSKLSKIGVKRKRVHVDKPLVAELSSAASLMNLTNSDASLVSI